MRALLSFTLGLTLLAAPASSQSIVAIGDIHGDLDAFNRILRAAGLADQGGKWIGGRTILVQTGDYTDRGPDVRAVLDRLMALETDAKAAGGRVVPLLGNHEVMNLLGEFRDVSPATYASFADNRSDERRDEAWKDYQRLAERVPEAHRQAAVYQQAGEAWMNAHPPGFLEYHDALAPNGRYGASLRKRDMVTLVGDSIFMHAGLPPSTEAPKLDDINDELRGEIRRMDRFVDQLVDKKLALPFFTLNEIVQVAQDIVQVASNAIEAARKEKRYLDRTAIDGDLVREAAEILKINTWTALNPEGPLWYRGLSMVPDAPSGEPFQTLLQRYGAARFVTGHTPTSNRRINVRFGGRAILIDTGMLASYFKGRPSALRIDGANLTAIYEDEQVTLTPAARAADGRVRPAQLRAGASGE